MLLWYITLNQCLDIIARIPPPTSNHPESLHVKLRSKGMIEDRVTSRIVTQCAFRSSTSTTSMPGPRNRNKQRKLAIKKEKAAVKSKSVAEPSPPSPPPPPQALPETQQLQPQSNDSRETSYEPDVQTPLDELQHDDPRIAAPVCDSPPPSEPLPPHRASPKHSIPYQHPDDPLPMPCVHDPGNGPRVKDLFAFIESAYATKPTLDDPQCREYYYQDVLDLLVELLPRETAVVSSFSKHMICEMDSLMRLMLDIMV